MHKDLEKLTNWIRDRELKIKVREMLETVTLSTWAKKASKNHHPPDERGEWGNLIHTKRVVKVARFLAQHFGESESAAISVGLLHDAFRYGPDAEAEWTLPNHADLAADWAAENGLDPELVEALRSHMSKWGKVYYCPELSLKDILVLADMIASQPWILVDSR